MSLVIMYTYSAINNLNPYSNYYTDCCLLPCKVKLPAPLLQNHRFVHWIKL